MLSSSNDLIDHYDEAARFCRVIHDDANGAFFQALWTMNSTTAATWKPGCSSWAGAGRRGYARYGPKAPIRPRSPLQSHLLSAALPLPLQ